MKAGDYKEVLEAAAEQGVGFEQMHAFGFP